jgi:hypothetical protein
MKCITSIIPGMMLGACLFFASCGDDDKINGVAIANAELKAALQQKGFTFDEQGQLLLDDKVTKATTLDLSGCNLTDASGLDVFPKLAEVNLANNKFGFVFDFSVLPKCGRFTVYRHESILYRSQCIFLVKNRLRVEIPSDKIRFFPSGNTKYKHDLYQLDGSNKLILRSYH